VQNRQLVEGTPPEVRLGLGANWQQFSLLVLINAFVGGMVGLERTIVPLLGPQTFHIAKATVVAPFVISFGVERRHELGDFSNVLRIFRPRRRRHWSIESGLPGDLGRTANLDRTVERSPGSQ
jgi:hypothetical protein